MNVKYFLLICGLMCFELNAPRIMINGRILEVGMIQDALNALENEIAINIVDFNKYVHIWNADKQNKRIIDEIFYLLTDIFPKIF